MRIFVEVPDDAAPGRYGVYVLRDEADQILYIGHTGNLYVRLRHHKSQRPWWTQVRSLEWVPCQGYAEARATEKSLITLFQPLHNESDVRELPTPRLKARTPELPSWTVARLTEMREEEAASGRGDSAARERLDLYITSLRNAGWSLEVIGRALDMTRERVRQRQQRAGGRELKGACVPYPPVKVVAPKRVKPTIPAAALAELKALQAEARSVNGATPLDDPRRAATVRYTELIAEQYVSGVSIYRIAKQLGVTHLAIRARLARHGYIEPVKGLPGNTAYGTPRRTAALNECHRGHSLEDMSNVRFVNGDPARRVCRACERIRTQRYQTRQAARRAHADETAVA